MIDKLRKVLKQEDTVLFIGSGVSLWSGLPTWTGLIRELAGFVKSEGFNPEMILKVLEGGDLPKAASYGFDKLTKPQIAEFIRSSCRLDTAQPHEIHHKIISLGPTCYVTTNYDKLLELSFQQWLHGIRIRIVLNTQLTETAEITKTKASRFLFKLHGDCESSDSVILSEQQYEKLKSTGELKNALESMKTLMLTRPLVYVGFGLRDPDFIFLKDLVKDTYKGGARDHYAIMADINEQDTDFWRREYGVHLINYQTVKTPEGKSDYSAILNLIDQLLIPDNTENKSDEIVNDKFLLTLMRYASNYSRNGNSDEVIPLVVQSVQRHKYAESQDFNFYKYHGAPVERLLNEGPERLILKGAPGGGKSFAMKKSVAHFAEALFEGCLKGTFDPGSSVIPVFADLKLYRGNLEELIEQNLPIGLRLNFLLEHFKLKFFLDAFNEIPREFMETKAWYSDLSIFLDKTSESPVVISSRSEEGLDNLDFPLYALNLISEEFISKKLSEAGLGIKGVFAVEVFTILRRPFFYKLVFVSGFHIDDNTTPNKIYHDLLILIKTKFQERFKTEFNLLPCLSKAAMQAMDQGEEVFKIAILKSSLAEELEKNKINSPIPLEIVNWLVSQDFIFPFTDERISFFHQSVTEYLSATRLAEIFAHSPVVLKEKLSFKRWDQALFLTMGLLDKKKAELFFKTLLKIDFTLAASSVKYMEANTEELTERFLNEMYNRIVKNPGLSYDYGRILNKLPATSFHIPGLKKLAALGDVVGSEAAEILLDLLGKEYKSEAIDLIVKRWDDSNFGSAVGDRLKNMITEADLPYLKKLTDQIQAGRNSETDNDYSGFLEGISGMVAEIKPDLVYQTFYNPGVSVREQQVQIDILNNFLYENQTTESLKISLHLLEDGIENALVAISFITSPNEDLSKIDFSVFSQKHVEMLVGFIRGEKTGNTNWAFSSLRNICAKRTDLSLWLLEIAGNESGIIKIALLYLANSDGSQKNLFDLFGDLAELSPKALVKEPLFLIGQMGEIEWQCQEKLFVQLLKLRNIKLATELCDTVTQYREDKKFPVLDIGRIFWWLDWFREFNHEELEGELFSHSIGKVITTKVSRDKRNEFVQEFNNPGSGYRETISTFIFSSFDTLDISELTDESVRYLIDELKDKYDDINGSVLEKIAPESFVTNRLIPLLKSAKKGKHLRNLKTLIDKLGGKFGRRYLVD